jgi:dephospho-CoA kinase
VLTLRKVAITGGVASGKSVVAQDLRDLGAQVVDTDAIVHDLLTPRTSIGQRVIHLLGPDILEGGKLSRRKIAERVFKDPEQLYALEQILHPAVFQKMVEFYEQACSQNTARAFVVEVPLLFEAGWEDWFDWVLAVLADDATCRARFRYAGFSDEEYHLRMKRQLPPEEKARRADSIMINNGSLTELHKQVVMISKEVFSS